MVTPLGYAGCGNENVASRCIERRDNAFGIYLLLSARLKCIHPSTTLQNFQRTTRSKPTHAPRVLAAILGLHFILASTKINGFTNIRGTSDGWIRPYAGSEITSLLSCYSRKCIMLLLLLNCNPRLWTKAESNRSSVTAALSERW
jgi:hypothetical protein